MSSLSPLLQFTLSALGLFLYVHRAFGSFRGFSIFTIEEPDGNRVKKLNLKRRTRVWLCLFSRQIVAGIAAAILALPLNVLLSLIGLRSVFGVDIGFWISTLGVILAVGPIFLKMLISCPCECGRSWAHLKRLRRQLTNWRGSYSICLPEKRTMNPSAPNTSCNIVIAGNKTP